MDVLREREVKDSLERQLTEEQKLRGEFELQSTTNTVNVKFVLSRVSNTRVESISISIDDDKKRSGYKIYNRHLSCCLLATH